MRALAIGLVTALMAVPAAAQEKPVTLKAGPGLEQVQANCGACHSLDYIQTNSPFMTSATWDAEIGKMIKVFGAPISEADARAIGDYLKANYGADHVTENR